MKKFTIEVALCVSTCIVLFGAVLLFADGYTDPFYIRFTTPKQPNMILGTSRAAQALQPGIFQKELGANIFNYAFTIAHSPYGKTYYESIKSKLTPSSKEGLFIVTVDPWSICGSLPNPDDSTRFPENKLCLANTTIVDANPNIQYLFQNYRGQYYHILIPKFFGSKSNFLHKDGWLEISVPMDSMSVKRRTQRKVKTYEDNLKVTSLSQVRLRWLLETIKLLKRHGKVYLVRLPVHPAIATLEQRLMPSFDEIISKAINISDGYHDMTPLNENFSYVDGNHLYKTSGDSVSRRIARWIKTQQNLLVKLTPRSK